MRYPALNYSNTAKALRFELPGNMASQAVSTVLASDPSAVNDRTQQPVLPKTSKINVGPAFDYEAPANSLTVIRINSRKR